MPSEPHPETETDLPWLAFRYVAGELAGVEAAAFERRLDADQRAREAVAEAVELAGAVALLGPDVLAFRPAGPPRPRPVRAALGWMAAGAAACLAAVAGLRALAPTQSGPSPAVLARPGGGDADRTGAATEIALAWSGLHCDDAPDDAELLAWLDAPTPGEAEPAPGAESAAAADDDVPPWLFEAAALPAAPDAGGPRTRED
ncbi:MAG TPA: hypothetical protein VF590_08840 [Isosphaeraceae bacterium]|jgi:hypothetical protein